MESGRVTEELVATRVEAGFALGADDVRRLPLEQTVPPVEGGGSVRPARTDSAPSTRFFEATVNPPGLARRGRYSVVPPQAAIAQQEQRGAAVAETDDVWTSADGDMVVLAQGGRLDATRALPPVPDATAVSLGPLGAGEELLSPQGCELRVTLPASGRYVRLYGTIGVSRLVAFAQTLRDTPGGSGLVFLNGQWVSGWRRRDSGGRSRPPCRWPRRSARGRSPSPGGCPRRPASRRSG